MYWRPNIKDVTKKSSNVNSDSGEALSDGDCFADKAKNWIYVLIVIVVIVFAFGITKFFGQKSDLSVSAETQTNQARLPTRPVAQTVAFSPCPYCRGMLDNVGRCNIPGCPIYDPHWGNVMKPQLNSPIKEMVSKPILIKEIALEVTASTNGPGVIVHSVYGSGWAQKAGLQPHDIIIRFNGRKVKDIKHFQGIVAQARPESNVKVVFMRHGKKQKTLVTIGEGEMEGVTQPVNWGACPPGLRR